MPSLVVAPSDHQAIEEMVAGLVNAWNAASGPGFARAFAEDADFVNIFGMHARGRQAIAEGHDHIFRTVYAGSTLATRLVQLRLLRDDVAVAHLHSRLEVPQGPMAGVLEAIPSMVLTRENGAWTIVAFHNTRVQTPPALHNNGRPQ